MSALPIVAAAVVGGLAAVERKAFLQAQIARPIVLAPLLGWILGDPLGGLIVGAPLELLWIGAANLGAALPNHETAAAAAIAASAVSAGRFGDGVDGALASLAFVLFAPLAILSRRIERHGERANERALAEAEGWLAADAPARAVRLHLATSWRPFVAMGLLVAVGAALAGPFLAWLHGLLPARLALGLSLGWMLLWAAGGAAAVHAARLGHGPWVAAAGALAAFTIAFAVGGGMS